MMVSPFDSGPDPELGRMLRERLTGPEPEAFLQRLRRAVAGTPAANQWDVLAGWAHPRVIAVAVAAGFLLWLGAWFTGAERSFEAEPSVQVASLPVQAVVMPQVTQQDEFVTAVMEDR
jgi:hypothetical protein